MDFVNNLKEFMSYKKMENISATEVAKQLNISKKTFSNYINGDAYIPLEHLNELANLFDVSVDFLLGLNDTETYYQHNNLKELNSKKIGIRLKEFRKDSKLTQTQLANLIGINKSSICRYESGQNLILTVALYTICKKYQVSADYLLGRIDSPKYLK